MENVKQANQHIPALRAENECQFWWKTLSFAPFVNVVLELCTRITLRNLKYKFGIFITNILLSQMLYPSNYFGTITAYNCAKLSFKDIRLKNMN